MLNQPPTPPAAPSATSSRITEIRIGCSDEYDGKAETTQAWLDSVQLYLLINHALYYDDNRKITFALSYMKKGSTAIWAEVHRHQGLATLSFRTFTQFQTDFKTTFVDTNVAREAMNWLSTIHIDSREQLQEYINMFKLNVVRAKYDKLKDAATLISYFSTGVPTWIMHRIQAMDTVPTTLALWHKKAAHFRLQNEIAQRSPSHIEETGPNRPTSTKVLAHQTLVPLVTQTPWISMPSTCPLSSEVVAFETAYVLFAKNRTVPPETTLTEHLPKRLSPLAPLKTRSKYELL